MIQTTLVVLTALFFTTVSDASGVNGEYKVAPNYKLDSFLNCKTIFIYFQEFFLGTRYYLAKDGHVTETEARTICHDLGGHWGLPDYQSYRKDLTDYMEREQLTSVWLSLKKQTFKNWMWLNDTPCKFNKIDNKLL